MKRVGFNNPINTTEHKYEGSHEKLSRKMILEHLDHEESIFGRSNELINSICFCIYFSFEIRQNQHRARVLEFIE